LRIYRELPKVENSVITIGSFDGLHIGHQYLIAKLKQYANELKQEEYVITFEPHPRLIVQPQSNFKLLTTLEEKKAKLEKLNVQNLIIISFSKELSQLSAEDFIIKYIIEPLHPKLVVLGYDHKFGKDRKGSQETFEIIRKNRQLDFDIIKVEEFKNQTEHISSTTIRNYLLDRKIKQANAILGNSYSITGKVIRGRQLGRTIGYPTANIEVDEVNKLIPPKGIYSTKIEINHQIYKAATSIGLNPTISDDNFMSIEAYILDFDRDIYGETVTLYFEDYIRDEKKFNGLEELQQAIKEDVMFVNRS